MIRTVRIPPLGSNRIGQTTETITYAGSTCTAIDPRSGLCIADVFLGDPSNPEYGAGGGFPMDPGADAELAEWAAATNAAANRDALNAGSRPASLVLAESMMAGNIPSPLPGLGITVPDPMKKWLLIGAAVVGGVILFQRGGRR